MLMPDRDLANGDENYNFKRNLCFEIWFRQSKLNLMGIAKI